MPQDWNALPDEASAHQAQSCTDPQGCLGGRVGSTVRPHEDRPSNGQQEKADACEV